MRHRCAHNCMIAGPVMCCNLSSLTNMRDLFCLFWQLQTAPRCSGWGLPFSSQPKNPIKKQKTKNEELLPVYIYNSIFIQMDSLIWDMSCGEWLDSIIHISHRTSSIFAPFLLLLLLLWFPIPFEAAAWCGATSVRVNKLHICPLRTHLLCVWITFSTLGSCRLAFRVRGATAIRTAIIIRLKAWGGWRNRRIKEYQKYGNGI